MKKNIIVNDILAMDCDSCRGHVLLRQVEAKNAQTNEATAASRLCKPILLLEKWNSILSLLTAVKGAQAQTALSR